MPLNGAATTAISAVVFVVSTAFAIAIAVAAAVAPQWPPPQPLLIFLSCN
jgi:hypothetical protein